ncbi:hypothetical protein GGS23DRAFT_2569 [Durotheca rogersii]|uniref:uncharacterized protein n=1 Tax=Durotheca rogersii TaxID=419775 RepID=UPI00221EF52D|nr:uncharacterized protein GGS23DRAFT_2569 [Durotheca rogersii]KAI5867934.1 hypothetical protein GGS23DRAFT_2569 [Durotheca rogersii]
MDSLSFISSGSDADVPTPGRSPAFGRIHSKLYPSTRTLDSQFMADYHGELDLLRRQWETRVFRYWEAYWGKTYSATAKRQKVEGSVQQLYEYAKLKSCQYQAIRRKRRVDTSYRRHLGLRDRPTGANDFPTDLDELASYWDVWYVTESQPTPYVRQRRGGGYIINEYYSSDDQLRLRKVCQKGSLATAVTCFKTSYGFNKLDVPTLHIFAPQN